MLRGFALGGQVEKTSYDDFYLEAPPPPPTHVPTAAPHGDSSTSCVGATPAAADAELSRRAQAAGVRVHGAAQGSAWDCEWRLLGPSLQRGVQVALDIRDALRALLPGFTLTFGVARGKLLARMAGPLYKPDAVAALPDSRAAAFVRSWRIRDVPSLR